MATQSHTNGIVSGCSITCVDGTSFTVVGDSLTDYAAHPVFLRFAFMALVIHVLLAAESGNVLEAWAFALLGYLAAVVLYVTLWVALGPLTRRRTRPRSVYTPLAIIPTVVIGQAVAQSIYAAAGAGLWPPMTETLMTIGRDCAAFLLFDLIHAQYVAPLHPLARMRSASPVVPPPVAPDAPAATPAGQPQAPAPLPEADAGSRDADAAASRTKGAVAPAPATVQVGTAQIAIADILMIRTEDHYLGITTTTGKTLQRAKLSDLAELHEAAVGIQINRSVWIAFAAIATVEEAERGQVLVTLRNGDQERVAKPRVYAFRQMYRAATMAGRG